MAQVLVQSGLKPGDRLAAQVTKSPEALALYAACVQAGIVFLPLNTAYTVDELSYFIENSGASMVVCDASGQDALAPLASELGAQTETLNGDGTGSLMRKANGMTGHFTPVDRSPDDLAAFLYTSGTTGRSSTSSPMRRTASITAAPGLTQSPFTSLGTPTAATSFPPASWAGSFAVIPVCGCCLAWAV